MNLCKGKIAVVGDQINGKKERSRRLNKTVNKNAADILSNIAAKISHTLATNNSKNAGLVATRSKASEDRKISSHLAFTDTTEQSAATNAQRFLNLDALSVVLLWFPLIEELLKIKIKPMAQLIIALDRTQWKENNVLMVSAVYRKRALPIFWVLLEKDGSSNLAEQQKVLRPVIRLLSKYKLVIIGDREFPSVKLASWLQVQNISFVFRQKQDTTFREKRQKFQPLNSIPVYPGIRQYTNINLTQKGGVRRFNLAIYWKRKYRGKHAVFINQFIRIRDCY